MNASRDHAPSASGVVLSENEAQAAVERTSAARDAISRKIDAEVAAAKAEINARYAADMRAATDAWEAAKVALIAAKDATPDHPWTGKRVFKMVGRGRSWERLPPERKEGIVETFRSTSIYPGNVNPRWGLPPVGSPIVRGLKKDGTPTAAFDAMRGNYHGWKLVEADTSERFDLARDEQKPPQSEGEDR